MRKLQSVVVGFTLGSLVVYAPLETYVTWSSEHTLLLLAYLNNVVGMGLMLWGALATMWRRPHGTGVLAVGWS